MYKTLKKTVVLGLFRGQGDDEPAQLPLCLLHVIALDDKPILQIGCFKPSIWNQDIVIQFFRRVGSGSVMNTGKLIQNPFRFLAIDFSFRYLNQLLFNCLDHFFQSKAL